MLPQLDPASTVVIVSDMHIGDGGKTEPFANKDRSFRQFLDQVAVRADALVIAGDGFDLAQAWSMSRVYEGHRELVEDLAQLARHVPVYYLQGNHDGSPQDLSPWLPLRYAPGLRIGRRVRVEHGHALDPRNQPGDERAVWGARAHALLERVIRSPVRIPMRKHYRWSTRLGHWLFFRYGRLVQHVAQLNDALGRGDEAQHQREFLDYWGRGEWGDIHSLLAGAQTLLDDPALDGLVWGHSHTPGVVGFAGGTYVNTGTWTYEEATYARYDHGGFEVRAWPSEQPIGDEEYRGVLGPHRDKSFFEWWTEFYRGWFRYDIEAMHRAAAQAH